MEHIVQSTARPEYERAPENDFVHTEELSNEHRGGDEDGGVGPESNQAGAPTRESQTYRQEPGNRTRQA